MSPYAPQDTPIISSPLTELRLFYTQSAQLSITAGQKRGGGAKVRASGYGVFAEGPRGEAFVRRRASEFWGQILGTDPPIGRKIKGLTGSVPKFFVSFLAV